MVLKGEIKLVREIEPDYKYPNSNSMTDKFLLKRRPKRLLEIGIVTEGEFIGDK